MGSVRVQLSGRHQCFTNFDFVEGRVILSLVQNETIAGITVKLEGESRTRLAGIINPRGQYDGFQKDQTQLEVHKLLYDVQRVFPNADISQESTRQQYTLSPGQYEYPFKFKIPINNNCTNNASLLNSLNSMRMDMSQGANAHTKKILPPSLGGMPGEAEIQYFVKATVQRPAFYKENFRAHQKFLFLPIEPKQRPPPNQRESFGRRTHQFAPLTAGPPGKNGLFRRSSTADSNLDQMLPPSVSVEGRLPDPAIVFCNEPLPLRILVTKQNGSPATLFLQSLHIQLIGYTSIRAHELRRQEMSSWIIMSSSDMKIPLSRSSAATSKGDRVLEVDPKLWSQKLLPNTVTPTFDTCNLSRTYSLDLKVGLSWGSGRTITPELTVQPIRLPLQVWSGIPTPQALVDAAAGRLPPRPVQAQPQAPQTGTPPLFRPGFGTSASSSMGATTHRPSDHIEPSPSDIPDDAPPSYEDAMADQLAPIDGPRRDYVQQQSQGLPSGGDGDEKGLRLLGR